MSGRETTGITMVASVWLNQFILKYWLNIGFIIPISGVLKKLKNNETVVKGEIIT